MFKITPLVVIHICIRAKQFKKKIPKNYEQILNDYKIKVKENGYKLHFSALKDTFPDFVSAAIRGKHIICNSEWAAMLVLCQNPKMKDAFLITLGHEMGHNIQPKKPSKNVIGNDRRFLNWVEEVNADFYAAREMVDYRRDRLLSSMKVKIKLKPDNRDEISHPSWERRKEYAENYNFDRKLIERIAEDTGCTNRELIDKACETYKDIKLK